MKMPIRWTFTVVTALALMLASQRAARADDNHCDHMPSPPGRAEGIDKQCPVEPNSNGIAKADFNGDGYADLAIGVPTQTINGFAKAGAVNVVYGSQGGLTTNTSGIPLPQSWSGVNTLGLGSGEAFGTALAAGDFDGDGYSDLAISVPGVHRIEVLYGSANGLTNSRTQLFIPCGSNGTIGGLSWGDYNGDTKGDLAVGCPDSDTIEAFHGTSTGLNLSPTKLDLSGFFYPNNAKSPYAYGTIGTVLASGDFDGDGQTDLAIGIPDMDLITTTTTDVSGWCYIFTLGDPSCAGSVIVTGYSNTFESGLVVTLYGSDQGLTTKGIQVWAQGLAGICCHPVENAHFGGALSAGDFNGDSKQDLAIGLPGGSVGGISGAGAVIIIYASSGGGLSPTGSQIWNENDVGSARVNNGFGKALAAGDFNGDGSKDLAIGIPNESINGLSRAGQVDVIYGSSSGLSTSGHAPQILQQSSIQASAGFGSSLSAWNFGVNEITFFPSFSERVTTDLAIGSPGYEVSGILNAGAISVLYGSNRAGGLTAGQQLITQGTLGFGVSADHFGGVTY